MRSVIKYLHMKGKTPLQIFHEMKDTYEDNGPSVLLSSTVQENSNSLASETGAIRPTY